MLSEVRFHLEITTFKNSTFAILHTDRKDVKRHKHQTISKKMSADQPDNDDAHQPLTLFAAVTTGQTVTGRTTRTTRILTQEELMEQFDGNANPNPNPAYLTARSPFPILLPETTTISQVAECPIESRRGYKHRECLHV
jgi:hypothetical protein